MNKQEQQRIINNYLRLIEPSNRFGSMINKFRYNPNNSDAHELAKFKKFMELRKADIPVMVEAELTGGRGRPDIIDLLNGEIYEILATETLEEAEKKTRKYPDEFYINYIEVPLNIPLESWARIGD